MDGVQSCILKVKKRLDSNTLDDTKVLKYLRALDDIEIGFDLLKTTGIGKTVNNLKKRGGNVAVLSKALIKKWKDLVPGNYNSPKKKHSPLNTSGSDFTPEQVLSTCNKKTDDIVYPEKLSKSSLNHEQLVDSSSVLDNRENKKRKATSMQLCDLSFVPEVSVQVKKVKKPKVKNRPTSVPTPSVMLPPTLTSEELGASLLPDIQPDYIPQRFPDPLDETSPRRKRVSTSADIAADLLSSRKSKTQVFSGKRSTNKSGVVLSLHEMCMKILVENIEALYDTGGVPYDILEPVLSKCNPAQLWNLEDYNPYFIEDTGPLWKTHCHRDFKGTVPEEHDDWRSLYLEKHEGREKKLKFINAKINASQAARTPVRQVKLAFVQTQAKAPPQVRRKQMKHGTGHGVVVTRPLNIRSQASTPSTSRPARPSRPVIVTPKRTKQTALMKKVKQMGKMARSRARSGIIRR